MILLVDGYNIIHASERYRKLCGRDMQLAINRLVADLIDLRAAAGWEIRVVFDGRGEGSTETVGGIEILFSPGDRSADSVIERLAFELAESSPVTVATSDYAQQKVIFRPGVTRMTARELEARLAESQRELAHYREPAAKTSVGDLLSEEIKKKMRAINHHEQ